MFSKKTLAKLIGAFSMSMLISLSSIGNCFAAPYTPENYTKQDPSIIQKYFKVPSERIHTPAFKEGKTNFTTHDEMMNFIYDIKKTSKHMQVSIIGESQEGRPIPLLIFSKPCYAKSENILKLDKPIVWLQGQIHGNEPAGGEAMLAIARDLAGKLGDEVLDKVTVIIVPRFNGDGSSRCERVMSNGLDGNRDHLKFDIKESIIIHKAFNQFKPEVVVDAHEYWACDKFQVIDRPDLICYHDVLMSSAKNLNIPKEVRAKSDSIFVDGVKKELNTRGYTFNPYYTSSRSGNKIIVHEAGRDAKIGRNAYGLQPSFSFLIETRGIGIGKENFERRVMSHVIASENIVKNTAKNSKLIKNTIDNARKNITELGKTTTDNDKIVISSKETLMPNIKLDAINKKGEKIQIDAMYLSSTNAVPTLERVRPNAYILPPGFKDVADRLSYSGVTIRTLTHDIEVPVETYTVKDKRIDANYYEGHLRNNVTVKLNKNTVKFPKGSYVFSMAQPTANLIAMALEPDAKDSFVTFGIIPVNLNDEVPVYRYMEDTNLDSVICKIK